MSTDTAADCERALAVAVSHIEPQFGKDASDDTVIDSGAAPIPRAEIEDKGGEPQLGLQARLTSQAVRKLAAILSAAVQGYSPRMGAGEGATLHTLRAYREVMSALIRQYRGRVIDAPGDTLLAEFASVMDAVQCAIVTQRTLTARNATLLPEGTMECRIGITLGEVMVEGERIYGEGVNIAARLERLAAAGGICIAGIVYEQIETKLNFLHVAFEYVGEQTVQNIAKPVPVYRLQLEPGQAPPMGRGFQG
jgi:adenylate cyclase